MPAVSLDARDRYHDILLRGRKNGKVHHPVLLSADQFLAVKQQYRFFAAILEPELRHGAAVADLRYTCCTKRDCFLK